MASKKSTLARQKEMYKKKYAKLCKDLRWFYIAAAAVTLVILALFFLKFIYIYNSDGYKDSDTGKTLYTEIKVNGWSYFLATVSGQFDNVAEVFGDISYFYYYDAGFIIAIGIFVVLSALSALAVIVLNITAVLGKQNLTFAAAGADIAAFILLLITMILVYASNASNILPGYCSSNPACSIRTLIYIPLVLSLAVMVSGIIAAKRYSQAAELLKKI